MRMKVIAASCAGVALVGVSVTAYADAGVSLPLGSGGGQCSLEWSKPGITMGSWKPAEGISGPSAAFTAATGTLNLSADPTTLLTPEALAAATTLTTEANGGFAFDNGRGVLVEVSSPNATLPAGTVSLLVKSPAHPDGVRIPAFQYDTPTTFTPKVDSLLPLKVSVALDGIKATMTPELAAELNTTFGAETAAAGDTLGVCKADFTAG
ncbi:hypothetical protein ACIBKX_13545 [Streptomyces sp. NPDC050658]|uniref:hypothetical protein n=1 Tax=unclassified Streptomyces TaxID=2593676 RepID=UPI003424D22F